MNRNDCFFWYPSFIEGLLPLPDKVFCQTFRSACEYVFEGKQPVRPGPEASPSNQMAWRILQTMLPNVRNSFAEDTSEPLMVRLARGVAEADDPADSADFSDPSAFPDSDQADEEEF